jgi:ATP-dependent Clp protease ATP-binding subunit ClpC
MFEKYTEKARRVIFFARYEASQHGNQYIETPCMLLGLMREDKVLFTGLLPGETDVLARLVEDVEALCPNNGKKLATSVDLPLSHASKRVLVYAAGEGERQKHPTIGTRHLLWGLLKENGPETAALRSHGIDLEKMSAELAHAADEDSAIDRRALHRLLDQVPAERLRAAATLLVGLTAETFEVSGTTPGGPFHYSFIGKSE